MLSGRLTPRHNENDGKSRSFPLLRECRALYIWPSQRDCSEIVDRPASGAIEALLDGTFAASNAHVQAFAPGSEG